MEVRPAERRGRKGAAEDAHRTNLAHAASGRNRRTRRRHHSRARSSAISRVEGTVSIGGGHTRSTSENAILAACREAVDDSAACVQSVAPVQSSESSQGASSEHNKANLICWITPSARRGSGSSPALAESTAIMKGVRMASAARCTTQLTTPHSGRERFGGGASPGAGPGGGRPADRKAVQPGGYRPAPPFSGAAALGAVWLTAGLAGPRPPAGPGGVRLPSEQQKPGGEDVGADLRADGAAALRPCTPSP